MKYNKGFAAVVALIILGIIVLGGAGYVAMNPEAFKPQTDKAAQDDGVQTEPGDHQEVDHDASEGVSADAKISIAWRFIDAGEVDGMTKTNVAVLINGTAHDMGTFTGSCSEIGANGGVDGKGLLAGELSAAQCWFAGSGDEIGVFASEDGGLEIMVGELGEGEAGDPLFRGNFDIKSMVKF